MVLADSVVSAPDAAQARKRAADLLMAAGDAADPSQKLLRLERAVALAPANRFEPVNLVDLLPRWAGPVDRFADQIVRFALDIETGDAVISADEVMLREAVSNLLDNALRHGGKTLGQITIPV